ncbi:MAG TPA: hypothetical protein PKW33_15450 [Anaerolineaceae bacterium]|nr:hypothetical protein [Anaerolineaceae bacterium]HPN52990.1 hypothetical protein [Anaerolineaceae bacterium]
MNEETTKQIAKNVMAAIDRQSKQGRQLIMLEFTVKFMKELRAHFTQTEGQEIADQKIGELADALGKSILPFVLDKKKLPPVAMALINRQSPEVYQEITMAFRVQLLKELWVHFAKKDKDTADQKISELAAAFGPNVIDLVFETED